MNSPMGFCVADVKPLVSLGRDDLMETGFIPADLFGPILMNITQVIGMDFMSNLVCPPSGWDACFNSSEAITTSPSFAPDVCKWTPNPGSFIVVALSRLDTISIEDEDEDEGEGECEGECLNASDIAGLALLGLCCCGIPAIVIKKIRGGNFTGGGSRGFGGGSDDSSFEGSSEDFSMDGADGGGGGGDGGGGDGGGDGGGGGGGGGD